MCENIDVRKALKDDLDDRVDFFFIAHIASTSKYMTPQFDLVLDKLIMSLAAYNAETSLRSPAIATLPAAVSATASAHSMSKRAFQTRLHMQRALIRKSAVRFQPSKTSLNEFTNRVYFASTAAAQRSYSPLLTQAIPQRITPVIVSSW